MANDPYTSLNSPDEDGEDIEVLVAELKRCYERMDELSKFAQEILVEEEPGYWVYNEERYPNAALDALDLLRSFIPTSE